MGRKLKLYLKMVEDHINSHNCNQVKAARLRLCKELKKPQEDDRNIRRRVYKRIAQSQYRLERPQEAKEQARRDWYVRSCRQAGIEPVRAS